MGEPYPIQRQRADKPWAYIRAEAHARIRRMQDGGRDSQGHAHHAAEHIAGHAPTDSAKVGAASGPCVKCGETWPCMAITVPWALTDWA